MTHPDGMDVTPAVPAGRQVIDAYGDGGFRISGQFHRGSVLLFPERTLPWPVHHFEELESDHFAELHAAEKEVDILLLGCGPSASPLPSGLREELRARGIVTECMDTGAACRTYNVLLAEERRVAAALIAVD